MLSGGVGMLFGGKILKTSAGRGADFDATLVMNFHSLIISAWYNLMPIIDVLKSNPSLSAVYLGGICGR